MIIDSATILAIIILYLQIYYITTVVDATKYSSSVIVQGLGTW